MDADEHRAIDDASGGSRRAAVIAAAFKAVREQIERADELHRDRMATVAMKAAEPLGLALAQLPRQDASRVLREAVQQSVQPVRDDFQRRVRDVQRTVIDLQRKLSAGSPRRLPARCRPVRTRPRERRPTTRRTTRARAGLGGAARPRRADEEGEPPEVVPRAGAGS